MKKMWIGACVIAVAAYTMVGLTLAGITQAGNEALAATSKTFTFDADHGAPISNNSSYSTATGISSVVLMKVALTSQKTMSFGTNCLFTCTGAWGVYASGSFYVSINNITSFTYVFTSNDEGTETKFEARLYKESLSSTLGTAVSTINVRSASGAQQTVGVSGCQTLEFYFYDTWAAAVTTLTSLTVNWSC
jgi:hypothetical protein